MAFLALFGYQGTSLRSATPADPGGFGAGRLDVPLVDIAPSSAEDDLCVLKLDRVFSDDVVPFELSLRGGAQEETIHSLLASCGCVDVNFEPEHLSAGSNLVYRGTFHAPKVEEPTFYPQNIAIGTDRRKIRVAVVANVIPISKDIAKPVAFENIAPTLIATAERDSPADFRLKTVVNEDVLGQLGVQISEKERHILIEFTPSTLRAWLRSSGGGLPFRKTVSANLLFSSSDAATGAGRVLGVRIPIVLSDAGELTFSPNRLDFGPAPDGQKLTRSLVITGLGRVPEVTEVTAPAGVSVSFRRTEQQETILEATYVPATKPSDDGRFVNKDIGLVSGGQRYRIPISVVE